MLKLIDIAGGAFVFLCAFQSSAAFAAAEAGKAGAITGPAKVEGIAQQRALALSSATAADLGELVKQANIPECDGKTMFLTDDPAAASKMVLAKSIQISLEDLSGRIQSARAKLPLIDPEESKARAFLPGLAAVHEIANDVVGIAKLFNVDYTIESFDTKNNPDWVSAYFMRGAGGCKVADAVPCIYSNRFPATTETAELTVRFVRLSTDAAHLKHAVDEKLGKSKKPAAKQLVAEAAAIVESMKKMQTSLLEVGPTGSSPIVAVSPYLRAVRLSSCVVQLIDSAPAGIVLTKETIFGKGGKVYLNTTVQLAAIVSTGEGVPAYMACRQRSLATTVRLAKLASDKSAGNVTPWSKGDSGSRDCQGL